MWPALKGMGKGPFDIFLEIGAKKWGVLKNAGGVTS